MGKQQRRSEQVKRESARARRDNRRWKRVLAKMSAERKVAYQGVGNLGKKGRTRGVTRRSQNTAVWSQGVKGVPTRISVKIERRVAENTDGASKRKRLYTVISHVPVASYKGLLNQPITA